MLFSEPKIPQSFTAAATSSRSRAFSALQRAENSSMSCDPLVASDCATFSALQRAENSSIWSDKRRRRAANDFQCSSASRKFLNRRNPAHPARPVNFQCSSASRKFLNPLLVVLATDIIDAFSALQRAENSSISRCSRNDFASSRLSVLFSEPKIPQS